MSNLPTYLPTDWVSMLLGICFLVFALAVCSIVRAMR